MTQGFRPGSQDPKGAIPMLTRLKGMSRGGWIAVGFCAAAIIAPPLAIAAFSDTRIVGLTGAPVAQVTPANQLRVAETDPFRFRGFSIHNVRDGACQSVSIPAGNAYVLKQVVVNVYSNPTPGASNFVEVT